MVVVINNAYYLQLASPSMDSIVIHGWQALLVVESSDEMYGIRLWAFLPCMDIPHLWMADIHERNATYIKVQYHLDAELQPHQCA